MAETNLIEFTADLQAFAKQIEVDLGTVVQKVSLDLLGKIVSRTPVDTGRARGSWLLSLDTPSSDMLPEGDYTSYTGNQDAAARTLSALPSDPYHVVFLVNNLPYAERLENGWSQMAPQGMVAISVAEVEAEIEGLMGAR